MKSKLAAAYTVFDAVWPTLFGVLVWVLALGVAFNLNAFQSLVAGALASEVVNGLNNVRRAIEAKK